jgi:signal transduction histidine kinase
MRVIPHQYKRIIQCSRIFAGVLLGGLLACAVATAQPKYQFDHWTTDDGLPQNAVNAILQTRDGYLWLATYDGLVRFDGRQFTVFNKSNTKGISSNRFEHLFEARHGALWATTDDGWLVKYQAGIFTTYTPKEGLPPWAIQQIEEDEAGNFQIVSREGIAKWKEGRFITYPLKDLLPASIGAKWINGNKLAWLTEDNFYLYAHGRLNTYSIQSGLPSLKIASVFEDQHRTVWINTWDAGWVRVKDGHLTSYPVKYLSGRNVSAQEDQKGNIWLAWNNGLGQFKDGRLTHYFASPDFVYSGHTSFYKDREGNLWIGAPKGLYRVREAAINVFTRQDGLSSDNVYSIYEDRAGQLWFGTWGGGVTKFKKGCTARYWRKEAQYWNLVTTLYEDHDGYMWIGTTRKLFRLSPDVWSDCNPRNLDGRSAYPDPNGFFDEEVWAIHQDRAGRFWFGTSKGLIKYEGGSYTRYTTADGLASNDVKAILEDRIGHLWFGTWGGLSHYVDGRFIYYTEQDGLASDHIRSLYEDAEGFIWIGTYDGGLTRFKDGRFTRYTVKDGLFNNGVFQILEDGRGYFWMSSNRGIYRVKRQELNDFADGKIRSITSVAYGKQDGMLTLECNGGRQPAGWKTRDGRLWFPTAQGAAVVDPSRLEINQQPPPVVIEEFRLDNLVIDFRNGVEIPHNKDSFEIGYTAPSFIKPEYIKFKYKLEGLDESWIDAGDRRTANYNRIPDGRYRFVVIAANSDGVWNTEGASLSIVIIPPFWRRWWFVTIVVVVMIATPLLIYRRYSKRRLQRVEKEKAAQEVFSRKLIESQEAERKRIAGELHDGLGHSLLMIRNWAQVRLSKTQADEGVRKTLTDISETALQSVEEVRRIAHHLRPHLIDDLGLTQAINAMLNNVADSAGLHLACEVEPIDNLFSEEDEINVYRIVQECLNNIIKHSGATEARVTITKNLQAVVIEIEDNGRGFDVQANGATGLGLKDITERARILGGAQQIDSVPGRGTKITTKLNLPGAFRSSDDTLKE